MNCVDLLNDVTQSCTVQAKAGGGGGGGNSQNLDINLMLSVQCWVMDGFPKG